jgi:CDP-diglyceride synthetase
MSHEILGTIWLLLPLAGGALLHGLCLKYGWLGWLARPIDGGRAIGKRPLFGRSKTWRGPVAVAAGAAVVWGFQQRVVDGIDAIAAIELVDFARLPGWWFGAALGAAAELAELPNSFVKRRLGIEPGATARGRLSGVVFYLWDQLDLLLGYWLVLSLVVPVTPLRVGVSLIVVGAIHPLLTLAGYLLGMRPTAR